MSNGLKDSIVLMGCKHCGKSTMGKLLSQKLGVDFFDTDEEIARLKGKDARLIYRQQGVSAFSLAEEEACHEILKANEDKQIIISTGGGICDNPPALTELRACGRFVFLRLDIMFSVKRIVSKIEEPIPGIFKNVPAYVMKEDPSSIKQIEEILLNMYRQRYQQYQSIADIVVDFKDAPIEENFKTLCEAI